MGIFDIFKKKQKKKGKPKITKSDNVCEFC